MSEHAIRYLYRTDSDTGKLSLQVLTSQGELGKLAGLLMGGLSPRSDYWVLLRMCRFGGEPLHSIYRVETPEPLRLYPAVCQSEEAQRSAQGSLKELMAQEVSDFNAPAYWLYLARGAERPQHPPPPLPALSARIGSVAPGNLPHPPFSAELSRSLKPEPVSDSESLASLKEEIQRGLNLVVSVADFDNPAVHQFLKEDFYRGMAAMVGQFSALSLMPELASPGLTSPADPETSDLAGEWTVQVQLGARLQKEWNMHSFFSSTRTAVQAYVRRRWGFEPRLSLEMAAPTLEEPYAIELSQASRGRLLARAVLEPHKTMVRGNPALLKRLFGATRRDDLDGSAYLWVGAAELEKALEHGIANCTFPEWMGRALQRWFWFNPAELFTTQDAAHWRDSLMLKYPALLAECERLGLGAHPLRRLLRQLLRWRHGIHDTVGVLESALERLEELDPKIAMSAERFGLWSERVRADLSASVLHGFPLRARRLPALRLARAVPVERLLELLGSALDAWTDPIEPVLVVADGLRRGLEPLVHSRYPWLAVVERSELPFSLECRPEVWLKQD